MGYYILGLCLAFCLGFLTCSIFSATKIAKLKWQLGIYARADLNRAIGKVQYNKPTCGEWEE
jgi:hypothetical protein